MLPPVVLQSSLNHFFQQFEPYGCCLIRVGSHSSDSQNKLHWMGCYSKCPEQCSDPYFLQSLEATISLPNLVMADPFEVISLQAWSRADAYKLYGCSWSGETPYRYFLMNWHPSSLSEHQKYGMSLYAQSLTAKLASEATVTNLQLHKVLQRNRHQLRTPLATMLLYVDLLKTIALDQRSQEWIQNLRSTIEEMQVSLNHLTALTDATDKLDYSDLRQLIIQCVQGMQPWIEQKQLTVVHDAQSLWVQVDEWKMRQVFQNLLSNAIAFAPIGGQITWEWQNFQTEVLIKISDNGPGLSNEDLRAIGTPFYSRRPGGTGLGLSIAQQIILEHRGRLWADNLPNGGAQFCITLPKRS